MERARAIRTALVVVAAAVAAGVPARPASAAVTLEVEAGFDGYHYPAVHIPVRTTVRADRLVRGTLEIRVSDWRVVVARPVEVPGGSTKEFVDVVPGPRAGNVTVRLLDGGGRTLARRDAPLRIIYDQEIAGLLPRVLGSRPVPGTAPLAVDAGTVRFTRLDAAVLQRAPLGMFSLGTIGATPQDLEDLTQPQRAGLERWIGAGGRLLVDASPGDVLSGLPEAWRPSGERAGAGLGEVVLTGDAMRAGRWAGLVEPTARIPSMDVLGRRGMSSPWYEAARDAGIRPPSLTLLVGALAVYALLAGPVGYGLLRRRRREVWLWVLVPAGALLVTAGSYLGARSFRGSGTSVAHQSVLVTSPGGGVASTYVGFSSWSGGERHVRFPASWPWLVGGAVSDADAPTRIVSTPTGPEAVLSLNPSEFGIVAGTGPVAIGDGLLLDARAEAGRIRGVVRNATPYRLHEAAVIVGPEAVRIGSLGPGDEHRWDMGVEPSTPPTDSVGNAVWPGASVGSRRDVSWALWERVGETAPDFLAPGTAVAVGWTKDHRAAVRIDGRAVRPRGMSLVVGRAPVGFDSGPLGSLVVRRDQVRGALANSPDPGAMSMPNSNDPIVLRFVLPEGAPAVPLQLSGPHDVERLEVWDGGAWQTIVDRGPGSAAPSTAGPMLRAFPGRPGPPPTIADYALPAPRNRITYVRITQDEAVAHSAWPWMLNAADAPEGEPAA